MSSVPHYIEKCQKMSLWWHGMFHLLYAQLFYFVYDQTLPKWWTIYWIPSKCWVIFFRILSQNVKLLWIFQVLTAAVKPKTAADRSAVLMAATCGVWLTESADTPEWYDFTVSVWTKSGLQDELKFVWNLTNIFIVDNILRASEQTAGGRLLAWSFNKMQIKPLTVKVSKCWHLSFERSEAWRSFCHCLK